MAHGPEALGAPNGNLGAPRNEGENNIVKNVSILKANCADSKLKK